MQTNNFLELARAQKRAGTMFNIGLDPHDFPESLNGNYEAYGQALNQEEIKRMNDEVYPFYFSIAKETTPLGMSSHGLASLVALLDCYILKVVDIAVKKCNIYSFKPQAGFYEQFGPLGLILLQRIRRHIKMLEKDYGRIICGLDCKRGDIDTTQEVYFRAFLGDLNDSWGINYAAFDFDWINVTPWMGRDVMVLGNDEKPGYGLKLMQSGKGLIGVNKTSNPSGPQYQELVISDNGTTLQMMNVHDLAHVSQKYELEAGGMSCIGLVVGSTHVCDGRIREAFPGTTLLVPGFGAQKGNFGNIMQELIPEKNFKKEEEEYPGQGAIFSASRASMFCWMEKYGGSGNPKNLEKDMIQATTNFRIAEKAAYNDQAVKAKGIPYPF